MDNITKKIKLAWNSEYNLLKLNNIKVVLNVFLGFTGIILLLVSLGPLKLQPDIKIGVCKKVIAISKKRWVEEYNKRGKVGLNVFLDVFKKNGFTDVETWDKKNEYIIIDPDLKNKSDRKIDKTTEKQTDFEEMGLHYAKEQLGYADRKHWPLVDKELNKNDNLFFHLWSKYNIFNCLDNESSSQYMEFPTNDFIPEIIEKIENKQFRRLAYENLREVRKVYTVFKIKNNGQIVVKNTKININLKDNPRARLLETLAPDGIELVTDSKFYKELNIPILAKGESKILVVETDNTFIPQEKVSYTYDFVEKINWTIAKKLLYIAFFLTILIFYLDKILKSA